MRKINWSKIKERIINVVKFTLFTLVMLMGFWTIYGIIWLLLGFPCNLQAAIVLLIQAIVSEIMLFRWFK